MKFLKPHWFKENQTQDHLCVYPSWQVWISRTAFADSEFLCFSFSWLSFVAILLLNWFKIVYPLFNAKAERLLFLVKEKKTYYNNKKCKIVLISEFHVYILCCHCYNLREFYVIQFPTIANLIWWNLRLTTEWCYVQCTQKGL